MVKKKVIPLSPKTFFMAIALVVGTVVGAGILGLPYVFAKSGFVVGMFNLVLVGAAVTLMTLFTGELALRTREKHQLAGFADKYLGGKWKYAMLAVETVGTYTALIAYLIGIGIALTNIFGTGSPLLFSTLFFVLSSPIVYLGIRRLGESELWITTAKLVILLILCFAIVPNVNFQSLVSYDLSKLFFPFGIVLFASLGYSVVPEVEQLLEGGDKRKMKDIILIAMAIVFVIYFLYTFAFVGNYGAGVNEIAVDSISPGTLHLLGDIFVLLTMITPFIALSIVIKDIYIDDMKVDKRLSWFLAAFIPFIIFVYGKVSFITLLEISGTYSGGLMGILTCMTVMQARKKTEMIPEYVVPGGNVPIYFAITIFVLGIIYQTLSLAGII